MEPIVLTPDQVSDALNSGRNRGGPKRTIESLIEGEKSYLDLMPIARASKPDAKIDSVYNAYNTNVRKLTEDAEKAEKEFPELKVVKFKTAEGTETVLLIHVARARAEAEAQAAAQAA